MASKDLQTLILGIGLCISADGYAEAEDDEVPDMAFLEYLGLWDESDEEWLLFDDDGVADNEERSDPVPEGEESTETDDES